jgi:hypothetical protein
VLAACTPSAYTIPDGQISVIDTPAGNQRVAIEMMNVPAPQLYHRRDSRYVVWIVPPSGVAVRAGELEHDPERRFAHGEVITPPYDDFRVIVSAEPEGAEEPGADVVVDQEVNA